MDIKTDEIKVTYQGEGAMRRQNFFVPNDRVSVWHNADDPTEQFIDYNIEFTRVLTPKERNQALAHFINGLAKYEVTDKYTVYKIDFSKPNFLYLTFQILEIDISRLLGYLFSTFRRTFPVAPSRETYIDYGNLRE